ncbi:MAG: hypothetical protein HY300_05815, partial [Verrucomicrobia bacterium]|nr:hypothetical protein [Verrucomicrobiota bacterium]
MISLAAAIRELKVAATMNSHRVRQPCLVLLASAALAGFANAAPLPTLDEAFASKLDVWGEAAIKQPNGASYEFFAPLLPPLRYVHADFRHYPIVLSAPNAKVKARL